MAKKTLEHTADCRNDGASMWDWTPTTDCPACDQAAEALHTMNRSLKSLPPPTAPPPTSGRSFRVPREDLGVRMPKQ